MAIATCEAWAASFPINTTGTALGEWEAPDPNDCALCGCDKRHCGCVECDRCGELVEARDVVWVHEEIRCLGVFSGRVPLCAECAS